MNVNILDLWCITILYIRIDNPWNCTFIMLRNQYLSELIMNRTAFGLLMKAKMLIINNKVCHKQSYWIAIYMQHDLVHY